MGKQDSVDVANARASRIRKLALAGALAGTVFLGLHILWRPFQATGAACFAFWADALLAPTHWLGSVTVDVKRIAAGADAVAVRMVVASDRGTGIVPLYPYPMAYAPIALFVALVVAGPRGRRWRAVILGGTLMHAYIAFRVAARAANFYADVAQECELPAMRDGAWHSEWPAEALRLMDALMNQNSTMSAFVPLACWAIATFRRPDRRFAPSSRESVLAGWV